MTAPDLQCRSYLTIACEAQPSYDRKHINGYLASLVRRGGRNTEIVSTVHGINSEVTCRRVRVDFPLSSLSWLKADWNPANSQVHHISDCATMEAFNRDNGSLLRRMWEAFTGLRA